MPTPFVWFIVIMVILGIASLIPIMSGLFLTIATFFLAGLFLNLGISSVKESTIFSSMFLAAGLYVAAHAVKGII